MEKICLYSKKLMTDKNLVCHFYLYNYSANIIEFLISFRILLPEVAPTVLSAFCAIALDKKARNIISKMVVSVFAGCGEFPPKTRGLHLL